MPVTEIDTCFFCASSMDSTGAFLFTKHEVAPDVMLPIQLNFETS